MASSFINIKDIGYWAKDGFVEAMQLCLINEIEIQNLDSIQWINEYKNYLALESLPMIYGGMSMRLDEYIKTDERKAIVIELINVIIKKIDEIDNYLTGPSLHEMRKISMEILLETNMLEFKNQEDFERTVNNSGWDISLGITDVKDRYQHSFQLLKMLINGEMNSTASSPETYWNY
ncbi:hypothetical protein Q1W71_04105 [Flavobacterium pectinovorum]|uniref:hypothetical protein n=1 Tax=Flavobacterium pectinovorum TaxID=29533 RepID=UPI00265E58A0|nr:hypothetical protein [Flavobacterium pectinovorum]WKL48970.1 hypothetical protein Q1W71_04105 [Flavobacterium pectinovorum]